MKEKKELTSFALLFLHPSSLILPPCFSVVLTLEETCRKSDSTFVRVLCKSCTTSIKNNRIRARALHSLDRSGLKAGPECSSAETETRCDSEHWTSRSSSSISSP